MLKMDTNICKHIKKFKNKVELHKEKRRKKYAKEYGTIIMEFIITDCGH